MKQAYIVDALRTPTGRRKGGLAQVHAAVSIEARVFGKQSPYRQAAERRVGQ